MARRCIPRKAVPPEDGLLLAISPDGGLIHSEDHLPDLPLPKKVVVAKNVLHVDGWHIRFYPMRQKMLDWIDRSLTRWNKADLTLKTTLRFSVCSTLWKTVSNRR